jgi:V/A-type H+/Na+-transporting ATPase subunit E
MSTQKVVDTILSQAKAEADRIRAEAQARIDADQAAHEAEMNRYREQTQQLAQAAAEDRKSRTLAAARMSIRKETLAAKVQWLDEVFALAKRRILSLPDEQYQELMTTLMVRAIRTGDERVRVGRAETRIHEKLIKQVNRQLGPGFKGTVQLDSQRADIEGGFLLLRGKIQVNAGIDVLIEQARRQLELELSRELFES